MREKVFGFLIVLFLAASLAPAGYEIAHRNGLQTNREFELVHNFPTDFNFYLSRIRQGIEGNVTVREQYTSEPHQGSFIHIFYLFLGWLGAWVRVPWHRAADVYHVARIIFGGLLLVMIAEFCKKYFSDGRAEVARSNARVLRSLADARVPSAQVSHLSDLPARLLLDIGYWKLVFPASLVAFLLAVTASTWPKIVAVINNQVVPATLANIGSWRFGGYMPWWSVMDSLQRITFIPHLLVGQALILFLIMALSDADTMKKPGNWIFLGIIAFVEGVIFPPGLLFIIVTIGALSCLELLNDIKTLASGRQLALRSWIIKIIVPRAVALGLGLPSLIYLSLMTSFYPWKRLAEFDIIKPLPFDYIEYLKAVGPILPLGIIGLLVALKTKDRRMWPAVAWVLAWALLLFVFKFIPAQSPLRFSEMIPHVPLGVLTTYLFFVFWKRAQAARLSLSIGHWVLVIPVALIFLGGGVMASSYLWQRDFIDHKIRATFPLVPTGSYVMYPLKDFIAAIRYIQDATGSRQTIILSETTAGNYIPVIAGNTVYVGHANTVRAEEKEIQVKEFFAGRMKPADASAWMTRENLHWVFFGPQEKEDGGIGNLVKIYPFLTEVYKNSFVTVYRTL